MRMPTFFTSALCGRNLSILVHLLCITSGLSISSSSVAAQDPNYLWDNKTHTCLDISTGKKASGDYCGHSMWQWDEQTRTCIDTSTYQRTSADFCGFSMWQWNEQTRQCIDTSTYQES